MGRIHNLDERGEHEGHVVGYVPRHWVPTGNATAIGSSRPVAALERYSDQGVLRELGMLAPDDTHDIQGICVIGYACACGWRAPYRELGTPLEWSPSIILCPEWLEDSLARRWWEPHVHDAVHAARESDQRRASSRVELALKLPSEDASNLLAFLNSLGNDDLNHIMKRFPESRVDSANLALGELGHELELLLGERASETTPTSTSHVQSSAAPEQEQGGSPQLRIISRGVPRTAAAVSGAASQSAPDSSARNDVIAIHADEASIAARFIDDLEEQRRKQAATRERWGNDAAERMRRLCRAFPSLRGVPGADPWDAMHLLAWLCTSGAVTTGSRHAAKFVLQVWNNSTDWAELARKPTAEEGLGLADVEFEPFNAVQALAVWDTEHDNAFRAWCELPFWP